MIHVTCVNKTGLGSQCKPWLNIVILLTKSSIKESVIYVWTVFILSLRIIVLTSLVFQYFINSPLHKTTARLVKTLDCPFV